MNTDLPSSGPSGEPNRKGSVKRARQMLDAGERPERASPPQQMRHPPVPRNIPNQAQWPLPDSGLPPNPINQRPGYFPPRGPPRGPPPRRPPHPSEIQSIYSERNGQVPERRLDPNQRPPRSFSQLQPPPLVQSRRPINDAPASPTSTIDMTPRISIATDDLFRQSVASTTPSIPDVPRFPPTVPVESGLSQDDPRSRTAGLVAPPNVRRPPWGRQSSVSPIPEEFADSRLTKCSVASSRAIPSSWGSGPAESEILGAYLDIDSDDDQRSPGLQEDDTRLVRNASIGKRGKPTMRTILKSNPVSVVDMPAPTPEESAKGTVARSLGMGAATSQMLHPPSQLRKSSTTTASNESLEGADPEKPPFMQQYDSPSDARLEKELEAFGDLPQAAPTMSDNRPGGRKPPALNMHALRDAEARGSLSSLTDLIRRATKLATNLDHGRTASRADLAGGGEAEFRAGKGNRKRNSGSISDMLASFPPPGLATPEDRASWPVFFGRSNLRNVEQLNSSDDDPNAPRRRKMCCGMPRKIFILICIAIFIVVILAVLLPVFLVAVPREQANSPCAEKNPCENGGVSVSGGTECSCVCSNGYTGSQCNIAGDGSCTTALIDNGSNATMGSALPALFEQSKEKFGITLDPVTIMALFSMNDISCKTENALVAFSDVSRENTSKARRSVHQIADSVPSVSKTDPTPVLAVRSEATMNGILYDDSGASESATATPKPTQTESATSSSTTNVSFQSTSTKANASNSTATSVPEHVVGFSRTAVLYILQNTGSLDSALSSEEDIQGYLLNSYANTTHPSMRVGAFDVDFEKLTITLPNSTVKAE
ncbi:hypothetical protein N7445_009383 [Penicillium cf. griseofulvum]|nr:hypothetical protein N7445_009383 [Penicillium cf. griseofulvum]